MKKKWGLIALLILLAAGNARADAPNWCSMYSTMFESPNCFDHLYGYMEDGDLQGKVKSIYEERDKDIIESTFDKNGRLIKVIKTNQDVTMTTNFFYGAGNLITRIASDSIPKSEKGKIILNGAAPYSAQYTYNKDGCVIGAVYGRGANQHKEGYTCIKTADGFERTGPNGLYETFDKNGRKLYRKSFNKDLVSFVPGDPESVRNLEANVFERWTYNKTKDGLEVAHYSKTGNDPEVKDSVVDIDNDQNRIYFYAYRFQARPMNAVDGGMDKAGNWTKMEIRKYIENKQEEGGGHWELDKTRTRKITYY